MDHVSVSPSLAQARTEENSDQGVKLNSRPSGLIFAPPPTETEGQTGGGLMVNISFSDLYVDPRSRILIF